jgi:hypothetical protein
MVEADGFIACGDQREEDPAPAASQLKRRTALLVRKSEPGRDILDVSIVVGVVEEVKIVLQTAIFCD